jgi:TolB protein
MQTRLGVALAVVAACLFVPSAGATLPGYNGLIAFSDMQGAPNIWTIEPDGSAATNLTPGVAAIEPAWSPDGTKIAYVVETFPGDQIWVMNADGSNPTQLTSGSSDTNPAWSPDGSEIAFSSTQGGANSHIWVMNSNGSNLRQLTTDATTLNAVGDRPDWSPDGTKIAFDDAEDIYVMNVVGTGVTRLTTDPGQDTDPSFSPNGATIIYHHVDASTGDGNIYEMSASGTGQTALTAPNTETWYPVWSPDGTKIALVQAGSASNLLTMNADGSGIQVVSSAFNEVPASPSWQRLTSLPLKTLTVSKAGSGQGTVTSSPVGISCGATCSHDYDQGTSVTLTAAPATGSTFAGWSGACSGAQTCTVTTYATTTVTATFTLNPPPPPPPPPPPAICAVPKVTGKTLAIAKHAITAHRCSVGRVTHATSHTMKKNHVISEKPKAGSRLRHGARVNLVVSKGL